MRAEVAKMSNHSGNATDEKQKILDGKWSIYLFLYVETYAEVTGIDAFVPFSTLS